MTKDYQPNQAVLFEEESDQESLPSLARRGRVPARGAFTLENMEDVQPPGSRTITTDFCVEKSSRFARTPRLDGQLVKNGEKNSSIF